MDTISMMASQAYAAAKPAVAGTQDAVPGDPINPTSQAGQASLAATTSSPAVVLDISPQVLKVEKFADLPEAEQREILELRQQLADKVEAQGLSVGEAGWSHQLDGKNTFMGMADGTAKILRADGYVATIQTNLTPDQESAKQRYFAELAAASAAEYSTGATASEQPAASAPAQTLKAQPAPEQTASTPATSTPTGTPLQSGSSDEGINLSDLPPEEQRKWLGYRERAQARAAARGDAPAGNLMFVGPNGQILTLTADNRILTRQQDMRYVPTPEQLAQRRAEDEQRQREAAVRIEQQTAWRKTWAADAQVWRGPMNADEGAVAESVARAEAVLRGVRDDISSMFSLHANVQSSTEALTKAQTEGGDKNADLVASLKNKISQAQGKFDSLLSSIRDAQRRLHDNYGYQITGNLVEKLADGNYREGHYAMTKASKSPGNWAIRVDSEKGVSVSFKRQSYTRDFKRMIVYDPGYKQSLLNDVPVATES